MNCKYCGKAVEPTTAKRGYNVCGTCQHRLPLVRRFVEVCDDLKRKIARLPKEGRK